MNLLALLFLISSVGAQSTSSDLCAQKKKQYGKNFVSCQEVDWGVTPISADYQPTNASPMTAAPSQVNGYQNDYPGIKNTRHYSEYGFYDQHPELKGLSLASKFHSAVAADPKTRAEDPSLIQWLATDWYYGMQPSSDASAWQGKCATWSAWSMDPEIQRLFSSIRDGILCSGIPFSKGELKEVVTALYPEPVLDRNSFNRFYFGYIGVNPDELEDANVALSKLGMFGQGDLEPADVLALAQNTKQKGKNMMMDRDPGFETWNQPIKKITDIAYLDDHVHLWEVLTSAEFTTSAGKPEQLKLLSDLAGVESELTQNLLKGNGIGKDRLCALRKEVGENCEDLSAFLTMSAQVDVVNQVKKIAYEKNMIQVKRDLSLVSHEMMIEYGIENSFASNAPDKMIAQSYTYIAVNGRSQWSPQVNRLSEICASPTLAEGRNSTSLTRGFDLKQKCAQGKPIDPSLANHDYFTGAVPPQGFKSFTPKPQFSADQAQQQKAYRKFLEFMATCDHFDQGVDFLKHLDEVALNNVITVQEAEALAKEYVNVKKLLDPKYIQSLLDNKYQGVQGVDSLKSKLKL